MENKNNNVHLLKIGESIVFGKSGVDYELEPGTVYTVKVDHFSDETTLEIGNSIQLPSKLYVTDADEKFITKVINTYDKSDKTLGVMLAGTKGTGKTVMAKEIAMKSNLPIITLDNNTHPRFIKQLFAKLENIPVCVIFDEFDKLGDRYDDDQLLQIFDGVASNGKHLILLTCNEVENVNEYMLDRCGRIRYYREFAEMSPSMVKEILDDRLTDKKEASVLTDFIIANFKLVSFDNIVSFVDEVNNYPDCTFEELFDDMNISSK